MASDEKDPGSWVIRNRETGKVVTEIFSKDLLGVLNTQKYEAIPIQEYLGGLNAELREARLKASQGRQTP